MKEVISLLKENTSGALATIDNGKPRVRPWGFMLEEEGRLYFCTANTKEVFEQLRKTPFVEFTSTSKDMVTVRVCGKIEFTGDLTIKKKVIDSNQLVKNLYKTEANPAFEVFYIEHGEAIISDFSGQPPRKFAF